MIIRTLLSTIAIISIGTAAAQPIAITIDYSKKVSDVKPTMWGIFFEDINFAADGGIYAELVKNRSFEFNQPLMGWKEEKSDRFSLNKESGAAMVISRGEDVANPRFARFNVNAGKGYSITNEGFRGMGVKKDMPYNFSVLASQGPGSQVKLLIDLVDANGKVIGNATLTPAGSEWKKYSVSFVSQATDAKAKLTIRFEGQGTIDLDMISLFPNDTWKQRPGGLRADLIQLLADLKPGFLRFPGGCIVEGRELATRYQWKKTVGKVEEREMIVNRWNTEFKHRPAPDYFQTFGLGFFEYFQLSEDIGAEPLPILSCGLACQFNTAEVVPMDDLDPYIQDALDLIEFANGPVTSTWGKLRANMGHPQPFNMKFIGIGNEQWGPQYIERYKAFAAAISAKYPNITLVSGSGPFPEGEMFEFANDELKKLDAKIIDEHYYKDPEWFRQNATRYDNYDRNGAKIFAGEYAAQSVAIASPDNKNNWECALAEAAFMTGLERNADVVHLTSYAPLFAHVDGWQWTPDLIWFDNLSSFGTPNYYVQKLFANNRGTHLLKATSNNVALTGQQEVYATTTWDKDAEQLIIKLVNTSSTVKTTEISLKGSGKVAAEGTLITLSSDQGAAVNSIQEPTKLSPKTSTIKLNAKKTTLMLQPMSFTVLRLGVAGVK